MNQHGPDYYIVVYDVNVKRGNKILKILRKYLHWVQNSVFEGELTNVQLLKMRKELEKHMNKDQDSIIIYRLRQKYVTREILGIEKGNTDTIF